MMAGSGTSCTLGVEGSARGVRSEGPWARSSAPPEDSVLEIGHFCQGNAAVPVLE